MLPNLILVFIALFVLAFVWLIWLRFKLFFTLKESEQQLQLLEKDLAIRRDMVPGLLEAFRSDQEINPEWSKLVAARAKLHDSKNAQFEAEFKELLVSFLKDNDCRSIFFLEMKKDIELTTQLISEEEESLKNLIQRYNKMRKEFPYSIASSVFSFKKIDYAEKKA